MQTHQLSLYIPRVFANISKERIAHVFESLQIGSVAYVDFVPREDSNTGEPYNMAFIHFTKYYDNTASENFQAKVKDPNHEAKIVYDDPWYWICLPNLNPKPDSIRELENRVAMLEQTVNQLMWSSNGYQMQPNANSTTSLFPPQNTAAWTATSTGTSTIWNDPLANLAPIIPISEIAPPPKLTRSVACTLPTCQLDSSGCPDDDDYATEFDAFESFDTTSLEVPSTDESRILNRVETPFEESIA